MGFFNTFQRSKRAVIRDNAAKGKRAERAVRSEYEMAGYKTKQTGKGHDFKATRRNGLTGKKDTKYVEVKTGNAKLSPLQKKKKGQLGHKYVVERRGSNPLASSSGNPLGTDKRARSTKRQSSGGLLGGSTARRSRSRKSIF